MTFVAVGDIRKGRAQDRADLSGPGEGAPRAADAHAHPREGASVTRLGRITQSVRRARAARAVAVTEDGAPDRVRGRSPWHDGPASPAQMLAYTRSGAWMPGDQEPWVERVGKAWGYFALLVTVLVGTPLWVVQRFSRFMIVLTAVGLLWLTWGIS